jgi:hypothetical protein
MIVDLPGERPFKHGLVIANQMPICKTTFFSRVFINMGKGGNSEWIGNGLFQNA